MTRDPMRDLPRLSDALHDADEVIGRIRNDGGWDRRYRIRREEPKVDPMREVVKILGLTIFILVFWVVILGWAAIAGAAQ